jgi:hypothetical protein
MPQNDLQKQIDELKTQIQNPMVLQNYTDSTIDLKNISSFIEVVTTVPTYFPHQVYEQVKLYYNASGSRLYIYDYTNSVWNYTTVGTTGSVYAGAVTSAGAAGTPYPTGWTASNTGTGNYVITHNLGTTDYAITANGGTAREISVTANSNTVDVLTRDSSGTLTDGSFNFILALA